MNQPDVPESYEDYLQHVDAQRTRDRDRFLGQNPHRDAPTYDARDGSEVVDNGYARGGEPALIIMHSLDDLHVDALSFLKAAVQPASYHYLVDANGQPRQVDVWCAMDATGKHHKFPIDRRLTK